MLTADDTPTIRAVIIQRLDAEYGVRVCDVKFAKSPDAITVGVLVTVDGKDVAMSLFDLPVPFELGHLFDEIDEIAEHYKAGKIGRAVGHAPGQMRGTGLRGRWGRYGLRGAERCLS